MIIFIAFIVSLAFIYRDGGDRVLASSVPFLASLMAILFYPKKIYQWGDQSIKQTNDDQHATHLDFWLPAIFGLFIVISALLGPSLANKVIGVPSKFNFECAFGEEKK